MSKLTRDPYNPLLQVQKMAYRCSKCSLCKYIHVYQGQYDDPRFVDICPSGKRWRFEAYYASGKQEIARGLITGEIDYTDKLLHALYTCTSCGGCMSVCETYSGKDPLKTITALKEKAVLDGKAPLPAHEPLVKSLENYGNPWQAPRAKRAGWAKKLELTDAAAQPVEVLLYAGCTYAYDTALSATLQKAAALLKQAGVDFGILGENELCCGSTLLRMGRPGRLREDGPGQPGIPQGPGGQDHRHRLFRLLLGAERGISRTGRAALRGEAHHRDAGRPDQGGQTGPAGGDRHAGHLPRPLPSRPLLRGLRRPPRGALRHPRPGADRDAAFPGQRLVLRGGSGGAHRFPRVRRLVGGGAPLRGEGDGSTSRWSPPAPSANRTCGARRTVSRC